MFGLPPLGAPAPVPAALGAAFLLLLAGHYMLLGLLDGRWDDWQPATCMPLNCFCERVHEGLVRQPANAVSNWAFALVGMAAMVHGPATLRAAEAKAGLVQGSAKAAARHAQFERFTIAFGLSCYLLGVGSSFYHASLTFLGQWVDNVGMTAVLFACAAQALARGRVLNTAAAFNATVVALNVGACGAMALWPAVRRHMFFACVVLTLGTEIWERRLASPAYTAPLLGQAAAAGGASAAGASTPARGRRGAPRGSGGGARSTSRSRSRGRSSSGGAKGGGRLQASRGGPAGSGGGEGTPAATQRYGTRYLLAALAVFALAFLIWTLDIRGIVCYPDSLLQGHAAWHLLNAVVIALLYVHACRAELDVARAIDA